LLLQPDMGTAAIYAATYLVTLVLCRIKWRYIISLVFAGIASAVSVILLHPYAMRRIEGFIYPELDPLGKGWHLRQLLLAVSRGSWFGVKSADAVWSRGYLPFASNDSAFAAITETLGAVGASLIPLGFLALAGILFVSGDKLEKYPDRRIYVIAAGFMMVFQSFLHISINLGLFPITGITLLFVSYGGSSMVSGALLAGIALSALSTEQK
ncbi:MAG: FtsW/RodA/SpoVE family cell cycle protein, partial [Lentisphaeria bacterium]|nr:FtsW/RodA/SpoVE family cell cycle protein [Lentisphaeria bacterium]